MSYDLSSVLSCLYVVSYMSCIILSCLMFGLIPCLILDLQKHPWFDGFDWDGLIIGRLKVNPNPGPN